MNIPELLISRLSILDSRFSPLETRTSRPSRRENRESSRDYQLTFERSCISLYSTLNCDYYLSCSCWFRCIWYSTLLYNHVHCIWWTFHDTDSATVRLPEKTSFRPRPHVSGNLWKRKFFFTNTACVHTYPAYFPAVSGNFWKRSPEWKFFYPIRIRIRVDGRIRKFANTLTSFSWIQSSRRAL